MIVKEANVDGLSSRDAIYGFNPEIAASTPLEVTPSEEVAKLLIKNGASVDRRMLTANQKMMESRTGLRGEPLTKQELESLEKKRDLYKDVGHAYRGSHWSPKEYVQRNFPDVWSSPDNY